MHNLSSSPSSLISPLNNLHQAPPLVAITSSLVVRRITNIVGSTPLLWANLMLFPLWRRSSGRGSMRLEVFTRAVSQRMRMRASNWSKSISVCLLLVAGFQASFCSLVSCCKMYTILHCLDLGFVLVMWTV